jgi:hypothetical protein
VVGDIDIAGGVHRYTVGNVRAGERQLDPRRLMVRGCPAMVGRKVS